MKLFKSLVATTLFMSTAAFAEPATVLTCFGFEDGKIAEIKKDGDVGFLEVSTFVSPTELKDTVSYIEFGHNTEVDANGVASKVWGFELDEADFVTTAIISAFEVRPGSNYFYASMGLTKKNKATNEETVLLNIEQNAAFCAFK